MRCSGEERREVTEAVEDMNMNFGGRCCGEERVSVSRFCKPARWGVKERRRVVKFTVQAAWIIVVAVLAI